MKKITIALFLFLILLFSIFNYSINCKSITLINKKNNFDGYTLITPEFSKKTLLLNNVGRVVHTWKSDYAVTGSNYLLEDGTLIHCCSIGFNYENFFKIDSGWCGRVEMIDWEGNLIWEFELVNDTSCIHNDIKTLPNGNILMIMWERKTIDEAVQAGCKPELLQPNSDWKLTEAIIEVEPTYPKGGNIVWKWEAWDHLIQDYDETKDNYGVVSDHPELFNLNYVGVERDPLFPNLEYDQLHMNSIDYNPELDQILLSSRNLNEIYIIDHSTTTEEAKGHSGGNSGKGGDILYRWGNPQSYNRGEEKDQKLFAQHDAQWIKPGLPGEGNILLYNNGYDRPGQEYSSIIEIKPPVDENNKYILEEDTCYGPEEPFWEYNPIFKRLFYSSFSSGCQRLPNGNTFVICGYKGLLYEVTKDKEIVWLFINRIPLPIFGLNIVFKGRKYSKDYPGLLKLNI